MGHLRPPLTSWCSLRVDWHKLCLAYKECGDLYYLAFQSFDYGQVPDLDEERSYAISLGQSGSPPPHSHD